MASASTSPPLGSRTTNASEAPGLAVADREHGGLGDIVAALEDGGDLGRLDAVAADLDLLVGAAEELQLAGRQAARQIAGVVPALAAGVLEHGARLLGRSPT